MLTHFDNDLAHIPLPKVRACLRNASEAGVRPEHLERLFGPALGPKLLAALIEGGYLEAEAVSGRHRRTPKGQALERARGGATFSREAAKRALGAFLERARALVGNPQALCVPAQVYLCGEMLAEAPRVASVELAMALSFTPFGEAARNALASGEVQRLQLGGRWFRDASEWTTAVERTALTFLRARSPMLHLSVLRGESAHPSPPQGVGLALFAGTASPDPGPPLPSPDSNLAFPGAHLAVRPP